MRDLPTTSTTASHADGPAPGGGPPPGDDPPPGGGPSPGNDDVATFERVDWEALAGDRRPWSPERIVLLVGLVALATIFVSHARTGGAFLVLRWNVGWEDWLVMVALVVIVAYGVTPAIRASGTVRRTLRNLRGRWGTILSIVVFTGVLLVGIWALLTGFRALIPWEVSIDPLQPPVGATAPVLRPVDCVGTASADATATLCHGTWRYPLGTDTSGYVLTELLVMGSRPVVYATFVTLGLVVPLATIVGVVAGYYGGLIDDLLMAYVDIQLSLPALLVYLVVYMFVLNSMFVFLVAFGLLSWGGIARIVRSETLQRREDGYVVSARAVGAPRSYIIRRHVIPNVSNSVLPAAFHLIAIIVITEAGLSFLGFNPIDQSWGHTIARGFTRASPITHWWIAAFPALALAVTVVSCKLIGDGLRDVLDPRGDG